MKNFTVTVLRASSGLSRFSEKYYGESMASLEDMSRSLDWGLRESSESRVKMIQRWLKEEESSEREWALWVEGAVQWSGLEKLDESLVWELGQGSSSVVASRDGSSPHGSFQPLDTGLFFIRRSEAARRLLKEVKRIQRNLKEELAIAKALRFSAEQDWTLNLALFRDHLRQTLGTSNTAQLTFIDNLRIDRPKGQTTTSWCDTLREKTTTTQDKPLLLGFPRSCGLDCSNDYDTLSQAIELRKHNQGACGTEQILQRKKKNKAKNIQKKSSHQKKKKHKNMATLLKNKKTNYRTIITWWAASLKKSLF